MVIELIQIIILLGASTWLISKTIECLKKTKQILMLASVPIALIGGYVTSNILFGNDVVLNVKHGFVLSYLLSSCIYLFSMGEKLKIDKDTSLYLFFFIPAMYLMFAILNIIEEQFAMHKMTSFLVAMLFCGASICATALLYEKNNDYNIESDVGYTFKKLKLGDSFILSICISYTVAVILGLMHFVFNFDFSGYDYQVYAIFAMALPILMSLFHWSARIYGLVKSKLISIEKANLPSLTVHSAALMSVVILAS